MPEPHRAATPPKVDPELLQQLEAVAASSRPVEAVIYLRPLHPREPAVPAEQMEECTRDLLARVGKTVGQAAKDVNIFRYLGSFVVSADAPFLKELIKQPEIASAMANRQPSQK